MIKYQIIEVNEKYHTIVVRYFSDVVTPEQLAIDVLGDEIRRCSTDFNMELPVPPPTGVDLHEFIMARAPVSFISLQEAVLDPNVDTSMESIKAEIGVVREGVPDAITSPVNTPREQERLKELIRNVIIDLAEVTTIK